MKKAIISITAALSLVLIGSGLFVVNVANTPETTPVAAVQSVKKPQPPTVDELLRLVNEERAKAGVAPLMLDARLNQSAQKKADDMVKNDYFAHVSPVDGREGYTYIFDVMSECRYGSENLRDNTEDANTSIAAIAGWKSSKPHREAMVDSEYTETGFGVNGSTVVEHFCIAR